MSQLDLHVELFEDGSGTITEHRQMYLDEGTEVYIILDNLGTSELLDFQVSSDGEPLTYEPDWDISASREEKAGYYGVVETGNGYELAWGIGEYGDNAYTVSYTLSDLVRQLEDGQSMFRTFFDGTNNVPPEEVNIQISGHTDFTGEDTLIWGFGFEGEVYLEEGDLVGWSNEPVQSNGHITILMQFTEPLFNDLTPLERTLESEQEMGLEGSSYETEESLSLGGRVVIALIVLAGLGIAVVAIVIAVLHGRAAKREEPLVVGNQRLKQNDGKYYREIPYRTGPMSDVYHLLKKVNLASFEQMFSAYILKWIKAGYVVHTTETKGKIFKKESDQLQLQSSEVPGAFKGIEKRMYQLVVEASGDNLILDDDAMRSWSKKNYKKLDQLKKDLNKRSEDTLFKENYLYHKDFTYAKAFHGSVVKATPEGEALFDRLIQFKQYLKDFSLLNERVIKEVSLWEELLIWASLYGVAEEVAKQLESLYPEFIQQATIHPTDVYVTTMFMTSMNRGYSSGVSSARAASGGGGGTSFGGGGGSFGGGGGGVR